MKIWNEIKGALRVLATPDCWHQNFREEGIEPEKMDPSDAVAVTACYKPTAEWHAARFRQLTPDQNLRLEAVIDREKGFCQAAVGPARGGRK